MKNIIAAFALLSLFASTTAFAGGDETNKKAKKSCCASMAKKSGSCGKDVAAKKSCGDAKTATTEKNS